MPLLRLLHQISNMYQNVKETQMELREQQPEVAKRDSQPSTSGAPLASNLLSNNGTIHTHCKQPAISPFFSVIASLI